MPEVFRQGSFVVRVLLPPREHGPAHVHVECPDGVVVVTLEPRIGIRELYGKVKPNTVRDVLTAIHDRYDECIAGWRKYHG